MITGAVIGFLIWAVLILISAILNGNHGWDMNIVVIFLIFFTGVGASIGYFISGVPTCS